MFGSWIRNWSPWLNYHLSMAISTHAVAQAYKVWISTMACSCRAPGMEIWLTVHNSRFLLYQVLCWTCHPVGASILLVMCMFQKLMMFWCTFFMGKVFPKNRRHVNCRADLVVFYQFFQRKLMGETSKELSAPGTSGSVTAKNTSCR